MKRLLTILAAATVLVAGGTSTVVAKQDKEPAFKLPASAKLLPDGSYSLGKKMDPTTGKEVEGIVHVDYKKQDAKPSSNSAQARGGAACYSFIAAGLKWKTNEPWLLDPANARGLDGNFLLSHTAANLAKWETAATVNIFGNGTLATGLAADEVSPDNKNEVVFGAIAEPGVVAVTITWGYYNAPTKFREIVEWDQVFDDQDYDWSAAGEAAKMDYDNVSTHELGHAAGMGHPANSCTEETMYAYVGYGETKKRDLNPGDAAGINALY